MMKQVYVLCLPQPAWAVSARRLGCRIILGIDAIDCNTQCNMFLMLLKGGFQKSIGLVKRQ